MTLYWNLTYLISGVIMKAKLLAVTVLAMLGLAQAAFAAPGIDSSKVATNDGSSGSLTCLQDVNCK
jgi:parvulin-like peptidyl-prolyl isomerase